MGNNLVNSESFEFVPGISETQFADITQEVSDLSTRMDNAYDALGLANDYITDLRQRMTDVENAVGELQEQAENWHEYVLYSDSIGALGDFTLSESYRNFKRLKIYYWASQEQVTDPTYIRQQEFDTAEISGGVVVGSFAVINISSSYYLGSFGASLTFASNGRGVTVHTAHGSYMSDRAYRTLKVVGIGRIAGG